MRLTAKQLLQIEEIGYERMSHEALYKQAMIFHTNRLIELARLEREWWQEMGEIYDFDCTEGYKVGKDGAIVKIMKMDEEENE